MDRAGQSQPAASQGAVWRLAFSDATRVEVDLTKLSPGLRSVISSLSDGGATRDALRDQVQRLDGDAGLAPFYYALGRWEAVGYLTYTLVAEGRPLVTWVALAPGVTFGVTPLDPSARYLLSRFAYTRRDGAQLVMESPRCAVQLRWHDGCAAQLLVRLGVPTTVDDLADTNPQLGTGAVTQLSGLLHRTRMLSQTDGTDATVEDTALPLATWEFHDLLFHSRSRVGRHANPMGGTYRLAGRIEPLGVTKTPVSGRSISLAVPDLASLALDDMPLSQALETRRSIRAHGQTPITADQLGTLLYRVARVRAHIPTPQGDVSSRPYPAAGALYELELYVLVQRCTGLTSGLYHYEPHHHRLEPIDASTSDTAALLHDAVAATAWEQKEPPQLLIIVTARFARIAWKYASMAYAATLKHVGVLYQTMYLVATSMNLAPCAIGAGNADRFARALGLDPEAESSVGEFLLGSRPQ